MSIDERHRIALHEAARDSWGPEIAGTLMEMLPPGGWAEVATKSDLAASAAAVKSDVAAVKSDVALLRSDLRALKAESATKSDVANLRSDLATLKAESATKSDLKILSSELRGEMAGLAARMERSMRSLLMWTVSTVLAGCGLIAAVSAVR